MGLREALIPGAAARARANAAEARAARAAAAVLDLEATRISGADARANYAASLRAVAATRNAPNYYGSNVFDAADFNRYLGDWYTSRIAPDDEIRWALVRLRTRARDLEKNNAVARHFLRMLHTNVIGPHGFRHRARVRDNSGNLNARLNRTIEDGWARWARRPTIDGRGNLNSLQRLALRTVARDGEVFIRKWRGFDNEFGFALELIDADLVDELLNAWGTETGDSSIRMGVEVDAYRRPIGYHIWNRPELATGYGPPRERKRIPAAEIIHLYDPDRVGQTRGPSWMASVMVPLRHLGAYKEAELIASRIAAAKMGFFKRVKDGYGSMTAGPKGTFEVSGDPGSFGILPDGYELDAWSPDHPSNAFAAFVKAHLRDIGTGLGASYNSMANDLEGVNYSSMRSGLLIEREYWRTLQEWWTDSFLLPVYEEWMQFAMLSGALKLDSRDPRRFRDVQFRPRGWPWVDPLKDNQATVLAIQNGLGSRTAALAEQGEDFEEIIEQLAEETRIAAELGVTIVGPAGGAMTEKSPTEEEDEATEAAAAAKGAA